MHILIAKVGLIRHSKPTQMADPLEPAVSLHAWRNGLVELQRTLQPGLRRVRAQAIFFRSQL
ncbi:MAG: hypothetical protein B7X31_12430 [Thiomonas sp. 13-66-29]|nr:MAG: hypothetical protein B7X46_13200 [Thiomonas sp. 15-66-11]OZB59810.1 MAG: hypothetical protein B7X31_12430 [Thiomonas sp. 13-66-29]